MASVLHGSPALVREQSMWAELLKTREMWASLAIMVMWLAVLCDAVWGPNLVATSGTTTTVIPSAPGVAFFAFLASGLVAKYGFRRDK
jgi:hypothetical protein